MGSNSGTTEETGAPQGPEAVREALIAATDRLCSQRSPALLSVRDIAAEAGVNHGQIHHYFGSKEGLIAATLERLDAAIADQVITETGIEPSRLVGAATLRPGFLRLLAWTLLERDGPPRIGELRFGRELARRLEDTGLDERDATVAATEVMVIAGGWALLEPALIVSNRLDEDDVEAVAKSLDALVESVLSAAAQAGTPG